MDLNIRRVGAVKTIFLLLLAGCSNNVRPDLSKAQWIRVSSEKSLYVLPGGKVCANLRDFTDLDGTVYVSAPDLSAFYLGMDAAKAAAETACK